MHILISGLHRTDHETELKIVKSRVRELELTLFTQREEVSYILQFQLQITIANIEYIALRQPV